jgi:hypothetical protein
MEDKEGEMNRNQIAWVLVFLFFALLNGTVEGATFCVSTSEQLQNALNTAATNGEDDTIQIVQATYAGNFVYTSSQSNNLTIEGGYSSGCTSRLVNPASTVLDAGGSGTVLNLQNANTLDLKVDALTLQNGNASGLLVSAPEASFVLSNSKLQYNTSSGNGGGVNIVAKYIDLRDNSVLLNTAAYGGGINIESSNVQAINLYDNFISQNITNSGEGGGVHIKWGSPTVNFINNVITGNATTVYIGGGHGGGAHISTYGTVNFINNTVTGNAANLACCWGGGITIYYAEYVNLYNNIFWDNVSNPGRDIAFYSVSQAILNILNNDIDQSPEGVSGLTDFSFDISNLNNVDPLFVDPVNEDYHLQASSPCIDTGRNDLPDLNVVDFEGDYRFIDGDGNGSMTIDMGADEYSPKFSKVKLLSPNGREIIASGSTWAVGWGAPSKAVSFDLYYSTNNGGKWTLIEHGIRTKGYLWNVPVPTSNKKQCLLKVVGYDGFGRKVGADGSDKPFTIEVIRITSPKGGDLVYTNSFFSIEWETKETAAPIRSMHLDYTNNGGYSWKVIGSIWGTLSPGYYSYLWETPLVKSAKTRCKVRVLLKDVDSTVQGSDASDGYFTIGH